MSNINQENLKDAQDLCYNEGVVFVCMWTGSSAISFVDIQNTIQTNVESLKRDALISHLQHFRLKPGIGAVPACSPRYSEASFEEVLLTQWNTLIMFRLTLLLANRQQSE